MADLVSSRVGRAFGSEAAYSDALSSVNKFNARLLRERRSRLRLPFVDSQTHIIQLPSQHFLWRPATHRLMPARSDQVSLYPRKAWFKKRPNPPNSSAQQQTASIVATTNGSTDVAAMDTSNKGSTINGTPSQNMNDDDPRVLIRAGDLGQSGVKRSDRIQFVFFQECRKRICRASPPLKIHRTTALGFPAIRMMNRLNRHSHHP